MSSKPVLSLKASLEAKLAIVVAEIASLTGTPRARHAGENLAV
jgi:hypothetical protein